MIDKHYNPDEWNIYLFHFSDGDNSSEADSRGLLQDPQGEPAARRESVRLLPGGKRIWKRGIH